MSQYDDDEDLPMYSVVPRRNTGLSRIEEEFERRMERDLRASEPALIDRMLLTLTSGIKRLTRQAEAMRDYVRATGELQEELYKLATLPERLRIQEQIRREEHLQARLEGYRVRTQTMYASARLAVEHETEIERLRAQQRVHAREAQPPHAQPAPPSTADRAKGKTREVKERMEAVMSAGTDLFESARQYKGELDRLVEKQQLSSEIRDALAKHIDHLVKQGILTI